MLVVPAAMLPGQRNKLIAYHGLCKEKGTVFNRNIKLTPYKVPIRRNGDARGIRICILHLHAFARILTVEYASILQFIYSGVSEMKALCVGTAHNFSTSTILCCNQQKTSTPTHIKPRT